MVYTLLGLLFAALSGIAVIMVYGADALETLQWVDTMFWSIIGAGMLLNFIDNLIDLRILLCRTIAYPYRWVAVLRHDSLTEIPKICGCNS